jgi:hypothetical protein
VGQSHPTRSTRVLRSHAWSPQSTGSVRAENTAQPLEHGNDTQSRSRGHAALLYHNRGKAELQSQTSAPSLPVETPRHEPWPVVRGWLFLPAAAPAPRTSCGASTSRRCTAHSGILYWSLPGASIPQICRTSSRPSAVSFLHTSLIIILAHNVSERNDPTDSITGTAHDTHHGLRAGSAFCLGRADGGPSRRSRPAE